MVAKHISAWTDCFMVMEGTVTIVKQLEHDMATEVWQLK
jgi:hypothetical protein